MNIAINDEDGKQHCLQNFIGERPPIRTAGGPDVCKQLARLDLLPSLFDYLVETGGYQGCESLQYWGYTPLTSIIVCLLSTALLCRAGEFYGWTGGYVGLLAQSESTPGSFTPRGEGNREVIKIEFVSG